MYEEFLDIDLFIEEVKIRPVLWDTKDEDYKDRVKRQQAWESICELMIENFTASTRSEKKLIVQRAALKWKNLKDNYTRSMRKQAKNSHTKKYVYAAQLSFINPTLPGMYQAVFNDYESDSQQNGEDDDPLTTPEEPETKPLPEPTAARIKLPKFKRSDRQEVKKFDREDAKVMKFDDSLQSGEDYDPLTTPEEPETKSSPAPTAAPVTLPKFKRSDRQEANVMKFDDSPSVSEQDEDVAFLNSLIPSVRRFNADQKLDFRIEVLNIIKQLKRK